MLAEIRARRSRCDYRGAHAVASELAERLAGEESAELAGALVELGRLEETLGDWDGAEQTMERALAAARRLPEGPGIADLRARALTRHAAMRARRWNHDEAKAALDEALTLATDPLVRSDCLLEAGCLACDLGEHAEATGLMQAAIAAAESAPAGPERDGALALALAGVGQVERSEGRFDSAAGYFERAIALAEESFGEHSIELAYLVNALGMNCKYSGRFDQAEPLYRRAEQVIERAAGTDVHPDIASIYHNLGGLEHARGDYERAEPYARRSVKLRRESVGEHPALALDEGALAAILDPLGEREEAEALLRQTIAKLEAAFGEQNHELAVAYNNLAAILMRRGELEEAEATYRRALQIKRALLGEGAPELGATMQNLAMVARQRGRDDEAEALYREALALMRGGLEPTHPSIARCVRNYAKLLRTAGREDEARALEAAAQTHHRGQAPSREEQDMTEREKLATAEDTEGHGLGLNVNETVAEDEQPEEDTEGHIEAMNVNETVAEDEQPKEDTEGHIDAMNVNETVAEEAEPKEDTEGHIDAMNVNETVAEEQEQEPEEDTEGHGIWENVNETVAEEDE